MKKKLLSLPLLAAILGGCAEFPSGGPGSSVLLHPITGEHVQTVTPKKAATEAKNLHNQQQQAVTRAIVILRRYAKRHPYSGALLAGDALQVRLWSYSGLNLNSTHGNGLVATNLSPVTVDPQGRISLPYLPSLRVAGDTPAMAAQAIVNAYTTRQIMEAPQAQVRVIHHAQGIWVYGAGNHHFLPWTPRGWTLAQALSGVSGGNSSGSRWASSPMHHSTRVHVLAHGQMLASLPIAQALHKHVPLAPGERLVEISGAPVQISVLGSGMRKPDIYGFDGNVPVSEVLAKAGGLNSNTADYRYVLLYHPEANGRTQLVVFHWDTGAGFLAAQWYLVQNNSVLYVSSQPIVKLNKALNLLLNVALPVQVFKEVFTQQAAAISIPAQTAN